jgi:hypothetical protein
MNRVKITQAITDDNLFGNWFRGASWLTWTIVFKVLDGLPLTETEMQTFRRIAGRQGLLAAIRQLWIMAGRRSGKSLIAGFLGVWQSVFKDWTGVLTRGEVGVVVIVCPDRAQSRITFGYAKAFVENIPMIRQMVDHITKESITFKNGIRLEIRTASWRTIRGYTVVCAIIDEAAFLRDETSANPFGEILTALKPAMATTNGLLIVISTPYSRSGEFYNAHQKYYGQEHPNILFLKGPTQAFNPTVPDHVIEDAFEADPAAAASEYGSLENWIAFRSDIESYVSRESVDAVIVPNRHSLPPVAGCKYFGFADPSGGAADAMTLAVAHREKDRAILDLITERRPPFSPESVVEEFAAVLKSYGISRINGDHYAGLWPRERFAKHGIRYEPADRSKSEIYQAFLPLLNSSRIELPNHVRLVSQLCGLERRTARGGRDSIDHGPGAHDDLINATAGALVMAAEKKSDFFYLTMDTTPPGIGGDDDIFNRSLRRY